MAKTFKQYDCNQCKKRIELFKVLREEDLNRIEEKRYEVLYHAGETIFKQGTSFTHTICILEGLVYYLLGGQYGWHLLKRLSQELSPFKPNLIFLV